MNGMPGPKGSVRKSQALDGREGRVGATIIGHQLNFQRIDPYHKWRPDLDNSTYTS